MPECRKSDHVVFDIGVWPSQYLKIGYATYGEECEEDLYGMQLGIYSEATGNVHGVYAGVVNNSRHDSTGVTLGLVNIFDNMNSLGVGLVNVADKDMNGVHVSVANVAGKDMNGAQFSAANIAKDDMNGVHVGMVNSAGEDMNGFDVAPFVNRAGNDSSGVKLAIFFNASGAGPIESADGGFSFTCCNWDASMNGVHVALFANAAGKMNGVQVGGFLNTANKMRSGQVGLVNVSDECNLINPIYGGVCLFGKEKKGGND